MKKTFIILSMALMMCPVVQAEASGVSANNKFPKKHLIEEFTGQDCGYCPDGMDAISEFMKDESNWILVLHHYGFAEDHFTVSGSKTISDALGVDGAPSSTVDRSLTSYYGNSGNTSSVVLHPGYLPYVNKEQYAETTYASVKLSNKYNASSRTLQVNVTGEIGKDDIPSTLKLTVLIKESGMIDYQKDYYNTYEGWEQFRHANAVRVFLTSATGNSVTVDEATHTYKASFSTTLDGGWVAENCMVVAFLTEDFQPVIQAEESPVVSGSKGGADIEHGGIKAVPIEDYYPEPDASNGPSAYSKQEVEILPTVNKNYRAYSNYGFNYWTIQAYDKFRTVSINRTTCIPFAQIHLFTELSETTIPDGVYEFNTSMEPGTAYAGYRDDEYFEIGGSEFYFINRSYFSQNYLVPVTEWLIASGTLTISGEDWVVEGTARNGAPIRLSNNENAALGIEAVQRVSNKSVKYMANGELRIRTEEGSVYNANGQRIQ